VSLPAAFVLKCPTCGETTHRLLHGRLGKDGRSFQGTVKCTECGTVRPESYREPGTVSVALMVSWMAKTEHLALQLPEGTVLSVGDRHEAAGGNVEITSLECGGRRPQRADVSTVDVAWARRVDNVRIRVAVVRGARTTSSNLFAAPGEEFEVGEVLEIGAFRVLVARIQLQGRTLTEGTAPAERIVKLHCKPMRPTPTGERPGGGGRGRPWQRGTSRSRGPPRGRPRGSAPGRRGGSRPR